MYDEVGIHAFYRQEIEALRAAMAQGLKARFMDWGEVF